MLPSWAISVCTLLDSDSQLWLHIRIILAAVTNYDAQTALQTNKSEKCVVFSG